MEIAVARESHIPEIVNLWLEFSWFHESLDDPWYPLKDNAHSGFESHLREEMAGDNSQVLIALDENCVVGYVITIIKKTTEVWERERHGCIDQLAITATCRRHGIGSQLLKEILSWFKSEDIDMIELSVAVKNIASHSFWKKHGFKDYLHHLYLKP